MISVKGLSLSSKLTYPSPHMFTFLYNVWDYINVWEHLSTILSANFKYTIHYQDVVTMYHAVC